MLFEVIFKTGRLATLRALQQIDPSPKTNQRQNRINSCDDPFSCCSKFHQLPIEQIYAFASDQDVSTIESGYILIETVRGMEIDFTEGNLAGEDESKSIHC